MSLTAASSSTSSDHPLLDVVAYAAAFDATTTLDELWRYAPFTASREQIAALAADDQARAVQIAERDGYFAPATRSELLQDAQLRRARARRLRAQARRVGRIVRHVPWVRGVHLTGSAAAGEAEPGADVDLLVICARGRIPLVFALLGTASRLTRRRWCCPNFYVSEDALAMLPHTPYVAREIAQAIPLGGGDPSALRAANPWIEELLPNLRHAAEHTTAPPTSGHGQRLAERALAPVAALLTPAARRLAQRRLAAHYAASGEPVPADQAEAFTAGRSLRFHRGRPWMTG